MAPQSQIIFPGHVTPGAPDDLFAAMGKAGQLINIEPSKGLVVVRMGYSVNTGLVSIDLQEGIWQKLNSVMN